VVPFLKYTLLRVALFAAVFGLLILLRAGLLVAVIGAALASMMLAYILLRGPREQVARRIEEHASHRLDAARQRAGARVAEDTAIEDAAAEAARRTEAAPEQHD
jgi:hypothetical protein